MKLDYIIEDYIIMTLRNIIGVIISSVHDRKCNKDHGDMTQCQNYAIEFVIKDSTQLYFNYFE